GIPEHGIAEWTGRADHLCTGGHKLFGALHVDAFALLLAQKRQPAAGSTTERPLARSLRLHDRSEISQYGPRFVIDAAIPAQITGIVIHYGLARPVLR